MDLNEWGRQQVERLQPLLDSWHGAKGQFWEYRVSLCFFDLRIYSPHRPKQNLHVYCSPSRFLSGPTHWEDCQLSLSYHLDVEYRNIVFVLQDERVGFKVKCLGIDIVENVEPLYG